MRKATRYRAKTITISRMIAVDIYARGHSPVKATTLISPSLWTLPVSNRPPWISTAIKHVKNRERLLLANGAREVDFPREGGMVFRSENLSLHGNGMTIFAFASDLLIESKTYYSIGGGFIVGEEHFSQYSTKFPFLTRFTRRKSCSATAAKPACHYPAW